jgi:hypothetical protein
MILVVGTVLLCVFTATAQTPAPNSTTTSTVVTSSPVKLPYGVVDVLSLSRARISEDVILNYIRNTGTIYNLGPGELVYLKNEGVSDRVLNAMLDQHTAAVADATAQKATPAVTTTAAPPVYPNVYAPATTPVYVPIYSEPEPSGSSVYILPYAPVHNAYYGYYGPRYSYYSTGYYPYSPVFSFGFRVGGGLGPHYHGGFHH